MEAYFATINELRKKLSFPLNKALSRIFCWLLGEQDQPPPPRAPNNQSPKASLKRKEEEGPHYNWNSSRSSLPPSPFLLPFFTFHAAIVVPVVYCPPRYGIGKRITLIHRSTFAYKKYEIGYICGKMVKFDFKFVQSLPGGRWWWSTARGEWGRRPTKKTNQPTNQPGPISLSLFFYFFAFNIREMALFFFLPLGEMLIFFPSSPFGALLPVSNTPTCYVFPRGGNGGGASFSD